MTMSFLYLPLPILLLSSWNHFGLFSRLSLVVFAPLCTSWLSLLIIIQHLEQRLQQSIIPVSVRLGVVEAVAVVTVHVVPGTLVLIDQVQSLEQIFCWESCSWKAEALAGLLVSPTGGGP